MTPEPNPRAFRDVLGRFATGVSVMTTSAGGTVHGMTANAVASVSLDPPLVMVCVDRDAAMADLVEEAGVFALSFLKEEDEGVAIHFADPYRPPGGPQFDAVPFKTAETGSPILDRCTGWVDCEVRDVHDGGDHLLVVGEVRAMGLGDETRPLLFYRGAYRGLRPEGS